MLLKMTNTKIRMRMSSGNGNAAVLWSAEPPMFLMPLKGEEGLSRHLQLEQNCFFSPHWGLRQPGRSVQCSNKKRI